MTAEAPPAGQEWARNWRLVFASMLAVTWVTAPVASLGLFLQPLHNQFGWSFATLSSGLFVYSVLSVILVPFAGALVDRFGTRAIALPGLLLNGLAFAAFGLVQNTLVTWYAVWVAYTLTQLMIGSYVWSGAVSAAFTRSRGLAIGVTMGGIALGQLIAPLTARWLIDQYGWRTAFAALGIGWTVIAFAICLVFFHDPRAHGRAGTRDAGAPTVPGLTLPEALRDPRFLRIAVAILLQGMIVSGITVHIVRLLTLSGVGRTGAATMVGLIGVAALAGQLVTGYLADRVSAAWLPALCFLLPGAAYALLLAGGGAGLAQWAGVLLCGFASGAAVNITTYLTTRFVGLANFGKIYGIISSCMRLGAGTGPLIAGAIVDRTGSYHPFLILGMGCAVLASLLVLRLGPYPEFSRREVDAFA